MQGAATHGSATDSAIRPATSAAATSTSRTALTPRSRAAAAAVVASPLERRWCAPGAVPRPGLATRCATSGARYVTINRLDIKGSSNDWLSAQVEECAFDAGDCGMSLMADSLPWTALTSVNSVSRAFHSPSADISALNDSLNTSTVSPPVAMTVPVGTKAVYFNLTRMLCLSEPYSPAGLCNVTSAADSFTFLAAEHTFSAEKSDSF